MTTTEIRSTIRQHERLMAEHPKDSLLWHIENTYIRGMRIILKQLERAKRLAVTEDR